MINTEINTEKILSMIDLNPRDFENVHGYLNMVELSVFEESVQKRHQTKWYVYLRC